MPATPTGGSSRSSPRRKKAVQFAAIIVLIAAASSGGAIYYLRYGDSTSSDFHLIWEKTKQLMKVEVPARLTPRLLIERPDVMTMVIYATEDGKSQGREACLAIIRTLPGWTHDEVAHEHAVHERGNPAGLLLRSVLDQYCPQFETERWTGVEEREISVGGVSKRAKIASSLRVYDHEPVKVVSVEGMSSEKGTVAFYYQSAADSLVDDEIDAILKSMQ